MKFHERFNIATGFQEAQERFVNRIYNEVWLSYFGALDREYRDRFSIAIASAIGQRRNSMQHIRVQIGTDFFDNLKALERLYAELDLLRRPTLRKIVESVLFQSEVDLGIEWKDGEFFRKGAQLLDDKLVNDVLHWLRHPGYESVSKPYEKGLSHFLQAHIKQDILSDVITDMYEALEALAKIVTGRPER